jgi:protein-arginine kinase activator protein McsA
MRGFAATIMQRPAILGQLAGIKLEEALMCVTCDTIYPAIGFGNNAVCPNCTSHSYLKLSTILNRTEGEEKNITQ